MKIGLLLILLIFPMAFAQNDMILDAKKAQLDAQAYLFIAKMNSAIEFAQKNNINTTQLSAIKVNFEAKTQEAVKTDNKQFLDVIHLELRKIANEFREKTRELMKDRADELRTYTKSAGKDPVLEEKTKRAGEIRKQLLIAAFDAKIGKLNEKISKEELNSSEAKLDKLLLDSFENEKRDLQNKKFKLSTGTFMNTDNIVSDVSGSLSSLKDFFVHGYNKVMSGEKNG